MYFFTNRDQQKHAWDQKFRFRIRTTLLIYQEIALWNRLDEYLNFSCAKHECSLLEAQSEKRHKEKTLIYLTSYLLRLEREP